MSISKRNSDLVPPSEMKTFMNDLGRVTDRESFNSLMRRFDDSFLQRYSNKPAPSELRPQIETIPPQSIQRKAQVPAPNPAYPQYSQYGQYQVYPKVQEEIQRVSSEGRYPVGGQDFYPNQMRYYQEEPAEYYPPPRRDAYEDPYRVPMYQRGPQPEYEKPMGYIRTDYINYAPQPKATLQSSNNNLSSRNPLQESMDLRRMKEDMLYQGKQDTKAIENMTLPPARYEVPAYDTQSNYFQPNFKSYYSGK